MIEMSDNNNDYEGGKEEDLLISGYIHHGGVNWAYYNLTGTRNTKVIKISRF